MNGKATSLYFPKIFDLGMAFRFFPRNKQPGSCAISNICATFATELSNVIVSMNTVTYKMPCGILETESQTVKSGQDKRDWTQYSRAIAVLMSKRMSELGLTQKMLAEKDELHSAIYIQDAERTKEYVIGNHLQNRKHIEYRNYQRSERKRAIKQDNGERKGKYKRHSKRIGHKLRPVARSN